MNRKLRVVINSVIVFIISYFFFDGVEGKFSSEIGTEAISIFPAVGAMLITLLGFKFHVFCCGIPLFIDCFSARHRHSEFGCSCGMREEIFQREIKAYEKMKDELIMKNAGKYAIFKGRAFYGVYDTFEEAYRAGIREFGTARMMIRKIGSTDDPGPHG